MAKPRTPRNGSTLKPQVVEKAESVTARHAVPPVPINLQDEIRKRAYELYELRGRTPGGEIEDWYVAEKEVRSRYQAHSA